MLSDKLVVAVKQTYNLVPEAVDFHLLNSWNYQEYRYREPEPIILMGKGSRDPETPGARPDLLFDIPEVDKRDYSERITLAKHRCFDDFLFSKTLDRPWGPGIVYELGIYLAVHLGVSELVAFGWDLGELDSTVMKHFFDVGDVPWIQRVRELVGRILGDRLHNKPRIDPGEVKMIADSTRDMYYWLKAKGVDLKIVSDRSLIDSCVPRISTSELWR